MTKSEVFTIHFQLFRFLNYSRSTTPEIKPEKNFERSAASMAKIG